MRSIWNFVDSRMVSILRGDALPDHAGVNEVPEVDPVADERLPARLNVRPGPAPQRLDRR